MPQSKTLWIRLSFAVSIILLIFKFYAFYITKSTAILTDALESIVNVVSAAFASYSIYLSSLPRDENHPYGHGKVEFFSAGVEGVLIMLAGIFILYQAVYNLFFPEDLENLLEGMLLIGFSGLVNGALGFALQRKGKALNSITLEASGKHLLVDTLTSVLLLLGIGLILLTGFQFLDSVIAILFSIYIGYSGYGLVRRSVGGLMDEADAEAVTSTAAILQEKRRSLWIDIHNMRVQQYGGDKHIDLHLTLPYYLNLEQVHEEVEQVEQVLETHWPGITEVFIHADPCLPEKCCHYCQVAACAARKHPASTSITWSPQNMVKNQKHYHELSEKDLPGVR